MKRISLLLTLIALLASFSMPSAFAAPKVYTLDNRHTYVLWHISHFGFSTQAGKWYASGTLTLDKDKPQHSKVEATIDVKNMVTGIPELDKHLSGFLFFKTKDHPTAKFVSDKVELTGKDTAKVYGQLTLRGETKPVTLNVKLNHEGINPVSELPTLGFSATADVNRSDFGMTALAPGLSDHVKLNIEAEAFLPKKG